MVENRTPPTASSASLSEAEDDPSLFGEAELSFLLETSLISSLCTLCGTYHLPDRVDCEKLVLALVNVVFENSMRPLG